MPWWIKLDDFDINNLNIKQKKFSGLSNEKRAIIYCRVSTKTQEKDWTGLENQEQKCRNWCKENNVIIEKVFVDKAISWHSSDRAGFLAAVEYIENRNRDFVEIDYFVSLEITRMTRMKLSYASTFLDRIRDCWARPASPLDWIESATATWEMITNIKAVLWNHEREMMKLRTRNAFEMALERWERRFSQVPTWYIRTWKGKKHKLEIDKDKAVFLKNWYENFARWIFWTQKAVLDYLKRNWVFKNKDWKTYNRTSAMVSTFSVFKLLFCAWYILYPEYWINKPLLWVHDPIISLDTAQKVISRLKKRWKNEREDYSSDFPLRQIAFCEWCWKPLRGRFSKNKNKKLFWYYGCRNRNCKQFNINKDFLHSQVQDFLEQYTIPSTIWDALEIMLEASKTKLKQKNDSTINAIKKQIREKETELDNLEKKILVLSNEKLIRRNEIRFDEIENEKQQLERELEKYEYRFEHTTNSIIQKAKIIFTNPVAIWLRNDRDLNRLLLSVYTNDKLLVNKKWIAQTLKDSPLEQLFEAKKNAIMINGGDGEILLKHLNDSILYFLDWISRESDNILSINQILADLE